LKKRRKTAATVCGGGGNTEKERRQQNEFFRGNFNAIFNCYGDFLAKKFYWRRELCLTSWCLETALKALEGSKFDEK
jgi:hypothetical protein